MKKLEAENAKLIKRIAALLSLILIFTMSVPDARATIGINELTQGSCTSDPCSTASVSPTSGSVVYIAFAIVTASGDPVGGPQDSVTVSGNGLTWTKIETIVYAARRRVWVYRGTGTASAGAVTVDYTGTGTYQETMWSVDEFTGVDSGTPNDTAVTAATGSGTSLNITDVGSPDAGDVIYGAFGFEDGADSFAVKSGFTALTNLGGGANVRSLIAEYDATAPLDETPGVTWGTSGNGAGGIGFIINMGASAAAVATPKVIIQSQVTILGQMKI